MATPKHFVCEPSVCILNAGNYIVDQMLLAYAILTEFSLASINTQGSLWWLLSIPIASFLFYLAHKRLFCPRRAARKHSNTIAMLRDEVSALRDKIRAQNTSYSDLQSALARSQRELERKNADTVARIWAEFGDLRGALGTQNITLTTYRSQLDTHGKAIRDIKHARQRADQDLRALSGQFDTINTRLTRVEGSVEEGARALASERRHWENISRQEGAILQHYVHLKNNPGELRLVYPVAWGQPS